MASQPSEEKKTKQYSHYLWDPKFDRAVQLFDSVFSRQSASGVESTNSVQTEASRKRVVEPKSETKLEGWSSKSSSSTDSIPDGNFDKRASSGSGDGEEDSQHSAQSSKSNSKVSARGSSACGSIKESINGDTDKCPIEQSDTQKYRQSKILVAVEGEDDFGDCNEQKKGCGGEGSVGRKTEGTVAVAADKENIAVYENGRTFDNDQHCTSAEEDSRGSTRMQSAVNKRSARHPTITISLEDVQGIEEDRHGVELEEQAGYRAIFDKVLGVILDPVCTTEIKCLSMVFLTRNCICPQFRRFFRVNNLFNVIMKALAYSPLSEDLAVSVSAMTYLLMTDEECVCIDEVSLELLIQMLRMQRPNNSVLFNEQAANVWDVLREWLDQSKSGLEDDQELTFDGDSLSPSLLVVGSLALLCKRCNHDQRFKNEMHDLGVLKWLVSEVNGTVPCLLHDEDCGSKALLCLSTLEKCFRILETCTVYNEKNQSYLVVHGDGSLLKSCGRLMKCCHEVLDGVAKDDSMFVRANVSCLCRLAGLLTNLTNDNEECCSKLGQISGFLQQCVTLLTYSAPRLAINCNKFELASLMSGLLANAVEKCAANRRQLNEMLVPVYAVKTETKLEQPVLVALTQVFILHEKELDSSLIVSGVTNHDDDENDWTEEEMNAVVAKAMNKPTSYVEESVRASHAALLIGCLLQHNREAASVVKSVLPDGKLTPIVERLQILLDFMKIASAASSGNQSVEQIIGVLNELND